MHTVANQMRQPGAYCLAAPAGESAQAAREIVGEVYARACRFDFEAPGFCLISMDKDTDSRGMRRFMVALKIELQHMHRARTGREMCYLSAGRFDQQVTTKLHRDGAPVESLLMLGYEPSGIESEVILADYAKCAFDMGITPDEFMEKHNPMFTSGEKHLLEYSTKVECFSNRIHQVLLINNSAAPYTPAGKSMQGVLHTARILNPDDTQRRVINSTMIGVYDPGHPEPVLPNELAEYVSTSAVQRRGNDKGYLKDDE